MLVSDSAQVKAFDSVFSSVFGGREPSAEFDPETTESEPAAEQATEPQAGGETGVYCGGRRPRRRVRAATMTCARSALPVAASDEERLRDKRFDALEPGELAQPLYRLMARLVVAAPKRRTRRSERQRRGERMDRRTLRGSMRTAGDPIRLARRRRRVVRRRMVMLCDISGSMEAYARAYLQFLTSAAGSGPNAEAFAFATRLTRLTRALRSRSPERAIQRAAAAAPTGRAARASATH